MKVIYLVVVTTDDGRSESIVLATHDENVARLLADRAHGRVERVPCLDDGIVGDDE